MLRSSCLAVVTLILVSSQLVAAEVIVDEDFEGYTTDAELEVAWSPDNGNGTSPIAGPVGLIIPRPDGNPMIPPSPYDGSGDATVTPPVSPLVGRAVTFDGTAAINEWAETTISVLPSATESVRLSADIFDFAEGNRRFSVGLRDDDPDGIGGASNLLELGHWQASDVVDPTDGVTPIPTTGYGYRLVLWDTFGGALIQEPNWQYFQLPIEFDDPVIDHNGDGRVGNGDGKVDAVDVGAGWHTYSATISESDVTLELDLFRNGSTDASVTWEMTTTSNPFNSLRMGGPSGVSSVQFTMVDNIKLETIDVGSTPDGDFDDNGVYECADIDALTAEIVAGTNTASFDLTGDTLVDGDDLDAWLAEAGSVGGLTASGNPVLKGDANLDGSVDGGDFLIWNNNKFQPIAAWCAGDFDASGFVDGGDFLLWNTFKFQTADGVAAVPEPTAAGMLILACSGLLFMRRS